MQWLHEVWTIATLEYKLKMRQKTTLAVFIFFMLFTFFCFPDKKSPDSYSIALSNDLGAVSVRGYYNSDWIGVLIIVYFGLLLMLIGGFLIRKTIRREQLTGYGELMSTSPVCKSAFFEGKRVSNFFYLGTLMLLVEVLGIFVQLLRGEALALDLSVYLLPFLIVIVPFIYLLATLALIFEVTPLLKGQLGNILLFILGIVLISVPMTALESSSASTSLLARMFDISGMAYVLEQVKTSFMSIFGNGSVSYSIFGSSVPYTDFFTFRFHWDGVFIMSRMALLVISFSLLYLIQMLVPLKTIFTTKEGRQKKVKRRPLSPNTLPKDDIALNSLDLSKAQIKIGRVSLFRLFYFQLLSILRSQPKLTVLIVLAFILQWLPLNDSLVQVSWLVITILPLFIWAQIGLLKEEAYLETTMAFPQKIIWSNLLSHWLLWMSYFSGTLIKQLVAGNYVGGAIIIASVILVVSLAYVCNYFTRSDLLFEVLFLFVWYMDLVQRANLFNFLNPQADSLISLTILAVLGTVCTVVILLRGQWRLSKRLRR